MNEKKFTSDPKKQKVLIVDDSEMNRCMLADILEDEYEIIQAENGVEAVSVLKEQHHDISLVMLDMIMPEMDGMGVLEVMNRHRWIENTPVIVISAESSTEYLERAYDLGVTDYIKRPFDAFSVRRRVINTIMLYANQKKLVGLVADQIYQKEQGTNLMISILSHIVEFRNGESGLHALHIRTITQTLLNRYAVKHPESNMTKSEISLISLASSLHDIGKISIPEHILNKPGRLTDEEFVIMKTHSKVGAEMLENLPFGKETPLIKAAYEICRWHHERYNGRGYPDGLKGDEIPLSAQVVSVADVYDALTSERVYKKAFSHEKAMEMILGGECGEFNPAILECLKDTVEVLKEELKSNSVSHISHYDVQNLADEMLKHNDINISDQTLNTLESERMKQQFLTSISREIQFEYISEPPMLTVSEFSSKMLNLPENTIDPKNSENVLTLISGECIDEFSQKVRSTTPEQPIVEYDCELKVGGTLSPYKIICRSLWSRDEEKRFEGVIGKVLEADDTHLKNIDLDYVTTHDPLTGLLNIYTAQQRIRETLEKEPNKKYAFAVISVECFRISGSSKLNHSFRDGILKFTAKKLVAAIDVGDIIAKIDGDFFIAFVEYDDTPNQKLERIMDEVTFKYNDFSVCAYMGAASTEDVERKCENLYACASKALRKLSGEETGKYLLYKNTAEFN